MARADAIAACAVALANAERLAREAGLDAHIVSDIHHARTAVEANVKQ